MKCPHCGKTFEDKNQKYRRVRAAKGICQRCTNLAIPGKKNCEKCLQYARDFQKRRREKRKNGNRQQ